MSKTIKVTNEEIKDKMTGLQDTLNERDKSHGDFIQNGIIMQGLKNLCRYQNGWNKLTSPQREAIDMICHKLGRILCGNPNNPDHWHGIAEYATLVENIILYGSSTLPTNLST